MKNMNIDSLDKRVTCWFSSLLILFICFYATQTVITHRKRKPFDMNISSFLWFFLSFFATDVILFYYYIKISTHRLPHVDARIMLKNRIEKKRKTNDFAII